MNQKKMKNVHLPSFDKSKENKDVKNSSNNIDQFHGLLDKRKKQEVIKLQY